MTKETKIGLLVGLAFIILFATILSEKGAPPRDTKTPVFVADAGRAETPATAENIPLQGDGRVPVENHLGPLVEAPAVTPSVETPRDEAVAQDIPDDEDSLPPLPESVVNTLNSTAIAAADPNPIEEEPVDTRSLVAQADNSPMRQTPGPEEGAVSPATSPFSGFGGLTSVTDISARMASGLGAMPVPVIPQSGNSQSSAGSRAAQSDRPASPPVIQTMHTVAAGECVGKIAAQHYGRSTPERVKAIYVANKDILRNLNSVREGDKLRIPKLPGAEQHFEPVGTVDAGGIALPQVTPARDGSMRIPKSIEERLALLDSPALTPKPAATGGPAVSQQPAKTTRWYEVRKGDSLSSIARRELGGERHYKRIFDLNRDVITNKNALKPGTKIRLPRDEGDTTASTLTAGYFAAGGEP